ncbi:hypothetical protein [Bordetella petrii]|uniref:Uncharacterized protein n=1 Tax=Bordetella petrii (strain ATCC BAA-461 / DSM 12804 / CCUG 43448 / CIP 107267 / Se-1111R) TaxID=340100 RepID=A9ID04_BORPD|nr:hypothetical protein [Bordetella petrii]CAP44741.1 hypothetical protein predicted by Glimmer/Critica [Bordetella petrii]
MNGPATRSRATLAVVTAAMQLDDLVRLVIEHLARRREPTTAMHLARDLGLPLYLVRATLKQLGQAGRVAVVADTVPEGRAYCPVEIGVCEWCGQLDHHLVAGECPSCRPGAQNAARPAHARRIC